MATATDARFSQKGGGLEGGGEDFKKKSKYKNTTEKTGLFLNDYEENPCD